MRLLGWICIAVSLGGCLYRNPSAEELANRPDGFYLEKWKVQPARNLSVDPRTAMASLGATAEACLYDSQSSQPLPLERVRIALSETETLPENTPVTVTDTFGCARAPVPAPVSFGYFRPESYLKRFVVVKAESGVNQGTVRAIEVAVNPWQKDDDSFFWDLRRGPAPTLPHSRVALQLEELGVQYPPQKDDFEVNAQLNLTQKDVLYLHLQPTVLRSAGFDKSRGPSRSESLWPEMRLRVRALVAGTRQPDLPDVERLSHLRLINGYETTATVDERGKLIVPLALAFDFQERPLLETQTRLFLELTVEAEGGPQGLMWEIPFDTASEQSKSTPLPLADTSFDSVVDKLLPPQLEKRPLAIGREKLSTLIAAPQSYRLWKPRAVAQAKPYELFLKQVAQPKDLRQVNVGSSAWPSELAPVFTPADFSALLAQSGAEPPASLSSKLCDLYFSEGTQSLARCKAKPDHYLRVHRFRFLDGDVESPRRLPSNLSTIQMNASFFRETSDGKTLHNGQTTSHNVDLGVTAKVGYETFGNGVTAHASYLFKNGWFQTNEHTVSLANRNRLLVQEMRTLVSEETTIEGRADMKECVFFRHRPWMERKEMTDVGRAERGYFFCRKSRQAFNESWFYMTDCVPSASHARRSNQDLRDRMWLVLLRGRAEMSRFRGLIENRSAEVNIAGASVFGTGIDHLMNDVYGDLRNRRDGGSFPGLLEYSAW